MNQLKVSVIIPTMNRKDDVCLCVNSILNSTYKNLEIIVIDNNSKDGTFDILEKIYSKNDKILIHRSELNLGAGGGRNLGARKATGDIFLFIDDDNIVNDKMISLLVDFLVNKKDICCMVGPIALYKDAPDMIWLYDTFINMYSSQAIAKGCGDLYSSELDDKEIGHLPNCCMMFKNDFECVSGYDEKYLIMYEEADIALRLKKITNKKIFLLSKAITYHNVTLPIKDFDRKKGLFVFSSNERAYLTARNRIYFMKKNTSFIQLITFLFIYLPLITGFYEYQLLKNKKFKMAFEYLKGTIKGFFL